MQKSSSKITIKNKNGIAQKGLSKSPSRKRIASQKTAHKKIRRRVPKSIKRYIYSVIVKTHPSIKTTVSNFKEFKSDFFSYLKTYKRKKPKKKNISTQKRTKGYKKISIKYRLLIAVFILGLGAFFTWLFWGLPSPKKLLSSQVPVSTKLFDRNGNLIYEIYADKRSTPVNIDELPKYVVDATIAIEDKDFYKHHGISITGITRAAYNTIFKQKLQGGSTLTQQLVKNALLSPERTIKRKLREVVITVVVEAMYSKKQILELYFNQIPYGSTAYGIGAAADLYFNKDAKDLTLAEAATLAGLTAAPTKYSPFGAHPEYAEGRREIVLTRMLEDKLISQNQYDEAAKETIKYADPEKFKAPHFALWVKEQLAEKYSDAVVEQGGLRVTTTLDLDLQNFAESAVATEVAKLKNYNVGNGALIVTKPDTGEILALVGSKNYFAKDEDGKFDVVLANRQPGSSIKPLNYLLALKDKKITLSTPLADVPTCFLVIGQKDYCPVDYDNSFHGAIQARFALGNSYNVPAVRVLALNGLENFIAFAKDLGITTFSDPKNYGLSLTLGGGEVKPIDMAEAYGVFANEGVKVPLISILKVEDWKGKVYDQVDIKKIEGTRVVDIEPVYLLSHTLLDNNARTAAFGESSYLVVKGHPEVSVKTGTTNDRRDNWTIGYTKLITTVVWVGNNDNSEMSSAVSGVSGASPIWNKVIKYALDKAETGFYENSPDKAKEVKETGHAWPNEPEGIVGSNVCATTGNLPQNPDAPECGTRFEYFLKDAVGANIEAGQKDIQIDKTTGAVAQPDTSPDLLETQNHPFLLDPLGTLVCLDCPIASSSAQIVYPLTIVPSESP